MNHHVVFQRMKLPLLYYERRNIAETLCVCNSIILGFGGKVAKMNEQLMKRYIKVLYGWDVHSIIVRSESVIVYDHAFLNILLL